jgi:tRNA G18 (ribose-2'-O)-methylase SpoU
MAIASIQECDGESLPQSEADGDLFFLTAARDRELRGDERLFLVESPRVLRRYLRHRWDRWACRAMLVTPEVWLDVRPLVERRPEAIAVHLASADWMSALSGYRLHGGALALGERTYWPPDTETLLPVLPAGDATLLVAAGVVQVDNIGSLFRSAACFGIAGVLLDGDCADPLLRKCIRFSMGRVFDLPWAVSRNLVDDLTCLRAAGFRIVALEQTNEARPLSELPRDGRVALVVGNEARGISAPVLAACDAHVVIPSIGPDEDGEARSLNVAVAASIALYQRAR